MPGESTLELLKGPLLWLPAVTSIFEELVRGSVYGADIICIG